VGREEREVRERIREGLDFLAGELIGGTCPV
jgi:hypothetical protein